MWGVYEFLFYVTPHPPSRFPLPPGAKRRGSGVAVGVWDDGRVMKGWGELLWWHVASLCVGGVLWVLIGLCRCG